MLVFLPIGSLLNVFELSRPGWRCASAGPLYVWGASMACLASICGTGVDVRRAAATRGGSRAIDNHGDDLRNDVWLDGSSPVADRRRNQRNGFVLWGDIAHHLQLTARPVRGEHVRSRVRVLVVTLGQ
jgi:hypothetical protein